MLNIGDSVTVISGKNAGFIGKVGWMGITRRQKFSVMVKVGGVKVWADPNELANLDGSPVQIDQSDAPVSAAAWGQQQAQAPHTRKRSVGDVRALEARVEELERVVETLVAAAKKRGALVVA
jgi:hypothetical protein